MDHATIDKMTSYMSPSTLVSFIIDMKYLHGGVGSYDELFIEYAKAALVANVGEDEAAAMIG